MVKDGNIVLLGAHITPLTQASTHVRADPTRTRRLLLKRDEINRLVGKVERAGYTMVPLDLHYTRGRMKLEIGLARGKKQHDKRAAIEDRVVEPRAAAVAAAADHRRPRLGVGGWA